MTTSRTPQPAPRHDADLQALADEIAAHTGVSAATALQLATQQRPALRQYAGRWNAAARRARQAAQRQAPQDVTRPHLGEE